MTRSVLVLVLCVVTALTACLLGSACASGGGRVVAVKLEGLITQGTHEELSQALSYASSLNSPLVVVVNTPGGSLEATKAIVESLLNSKVPVIAYVYPKGATAWSAGSLILLASNIAAMTPGTVIGSAQPVAYSPLTGAEPADVKVVNAVAKYMEQVATARGRNATAARLFVTENLNLGCWEALEAGVIDLVAEDLGSLLRELHGRSVSLGGSVYVISTEDAEVEWFEGGLRSKIVSILSSPELASVLFTVGLLSFALGLAYAQPASAIVGALLTILGLLGLGMDVNVVSMLLLIVGAVLLAAELLTPGFGLVGTSGIAILAIGLLLSPFSASPERWSIHPEWLSRLTLATYVVAAPLIGLFGFILYKVVKAKRLRPRLDLASPVGRVAVALDELGPSKKGFVMCDGEYWEAVSKERVASGERVRVVGKEGPVLVVERMGEEGGGGA
ncbi:MAG: nodulation protein NfeD [Candidatus Nezhaarchaeota archaeon]|nr:nodulation protein NfeD [Candidatus Nezhaarchaeota archaeon]